MTRKQKTPNCQQETRSHRAQSRQSRRAEEQAPIREKERAKAAAPKKPEAHAPVERAKSAEIKVDAKAAAAKGVLRRRSRRILGIERRVPVMPEERQSQLKLLIARGKEQGY